MLKLKSNHVNKRALEDKKPLPEEMFTRRQKGTRHSARVTCEYTIFIQILLTIWHICGNVPENVISIHVFRTCFLWLFYCVFMCFYLVSYRALCLYPVYMNFVRNNEKKNWYMDKTWILYICILAYWNCGRLWGRAVVMIRKCYPLYWSFVRGNHRRSSLTLDHQSRDLVFSILLSWTIYFTNSRVETP